MKRQKFLFAIVMLLLVSGICAQDKQAAKSTSSSASASTKAFLGRWDMTLKRLIVNIPHGWRYRLMEIG
jgi:hypothetical protein